MPSSIVSSLRDRLARYLVLALLAGSLIFLQILGSEKDPFGSLLSYSIIAFAAVAGFSLIRASSSADLHCLYATIGFVGYVVVRALTSPSTYAARTDLFSVLAAFLVYLITTEFLTHAAIRRVLIATLLAFAIVHVLVSIVQAGFGANLMVVSSLKLITPHARGTGLYANPDHLAGLLELLGILGLNLACWSRWPRWFKVIIGYLTAIAYLGLIFTASRGGYLSAFASLVTFAALSLLVLRAGGTKLVTKVGGIGLGVLILGILAIWFALQLSAPLKAAAENLFKIDAGRLDLWSAALKQWHLQPLVGTGSGTYLFYGREFRSENMQLDPIDVHNDYLHLLCEYGIIGLLAFAIFLFVHLRRALRTFLRLGPQRVAAGSILPSDRLALTMAALCAIAAYLIHSLVDFNLHIPANALLVSFVFALVANPDLTPPPNISVARFRSFPRLTLLAAALVLLSQSFRLLPGEYLSAQAYTALSDEEPDAARSYAQRSLSYDKQNPLTYFRLGRAQIALANREDRPSSRNALYEEALKAFTEAKRLAPLDGTYPLELGLRYDQLGRFQDGEAMFQLALQRDPRSDTFRQMYRTHLENWAAGQKERPSGN